MNKKQLMEYIGLSCRRWRLGVGYDIKQICDETGYCASSIYLFEKGINNNAILFMWYIAHGFDTDKDFINGDMSGIMPIKCSANDLFYKFSGGMNNGNA